MRNPKLLKILYTIDDFDLNCARCGARPAYRPPALVNHGRPDRSGEKINDVQTRAEAVGLPSGAAMMSFRAARPSRFSNSSTWAFCYPGAAAGCSAAVARFLDLAFFGAIAGTCGAVVVGFRGSGRLLGRLGLRV
jgi:hypothetical protein